MARQHIAEFRECVSFAMLGAPSFSPDEGLTREAVFKALRENLFKMKGSWWGGDDLYRRMEDLLGQAGAALDLNDTDSAVRALGEIYKIIDQTPRPARRKHRRRAA